MPEFRSLEELANYFNKNQQNVLSNQNTLVVLEEETQKLAQYIEEEIQNYLSSYVPTVYERTGNWLNSVKISPIVQEGEYLTAIITFDERLANHPSLFNGEEGYVPWLMEVGWHWSMDKPHRTYRLSDFEGIQYIRRAVERFNSENKYGIKVSVVHNGEIYI